MKKNIGKIDTIIRVILGLALLGLGVYLKTWWGLIGFIPLLTVLLKWCPLYVPFKISTRKE
ncbi:MAG: DUF2892 domain-containing protein [candidate division KSB1 bacterium]|nr:DUF2892 domain-containing protein [candidate division KSB1 bacterium]